MTDEADRVERTLSRLLPRELSDGLVERIDRDLSAAQMSPGADRLLWCAIGSGAIAACIIAAVLIGQTVTVSPAGPVLTRSDVPRLGSSTEALARADAGGEYFLR